MSEPDFLPLRAGRLGLAVVATLGEFQQTLSHCFSSSLEAMAEIAKDEPLVEM